MKQTEKPKLRPAPGWDHGWYLYGSVDTVDFEALLDLDAVLNGRPPRPSVGPDQAAVRPADSASALPRAATGSTTPPGSPAEPLPLQESQFLKR